jgi:hypothetical protein
LLAGIIVPLLAAIWQIHSGLSAPNLTQALRLVQTHTFLTSPVSLLLKETVWRCAVLAQYVGISLLVLLPFAFELPRTFWTSRVLRVPLRLLATVACVFIIVGLAMPSPINARPEALQYGVREPLEMYWLLAVKLWTIPRVMWILDIGGIVGGVILLVLCLYALRTLTHPRPEKVLLLGTGLGLLFLHLIYRQLNDTYVTALIPFALLVVGEALRRLRLRPSLVRASAAVAMIFMLMTALWMRGEYEAQEAIWNSADDLVRSGVRPLDVWAACWGEYHGSFDDWIADGAPGYDINNSHHYTDPIHDPYHLWRQAEWDRAHYRVVISASVSTLPGWRLIAVRRFRTAGFKRAYVLSFERVPVLTTSQQDTAKVR